MTSRKLHLGAAYYPEHWPEYRWPEDIRLMQEAGFNVVRMAEFAWSTLEPSAGTYDFDWLERAIELLARAGIASVLGTPTAAPPAWLVSQSPDLMAAGEDGRRVQFGNRCHYCVNSPDLHQATTRIVSAMAERFGPNPHVIGWQLDNEYNRVCYCPRCRTRFQEYLEEQYGTLDELNARWATRYWSQTYSDWEQIPLPVGYHNPGLLLAFNRFVTRSYRSYQSLQLKALRPHLPEGVWVTHNFMGWFEAFDHYQLTADLDLVSWDWYIRPTTQDYLESGAIHDLTRGFKRQNFWLMETQAGQVSWMQVNSSLNKGQARSLAWHAVGHGADAVLYWQWRPALGGQEQYHGSLVDQSGQPRPFYEEVGQLGSDFAAVSELLSGSQPETRVAILNDYESRWSLNWQPHHQDFDYVEHLLNYYRPLATRNIPVDILSADQDLIGYRLVIAPALIIMDEKRAGRLKEFVRRGGSLVLTLRSGMKDRHNALLPSRQPGPLRELAGVEVEEYYALDEPIPVEGNWFSGQTSLWAERLKPLEGSPTAVAATYGASNGWLDGQATITINALGSGMVYYVGAYLDQDSQLALIDRILQFRNIKPLMKTPPGVEVCRRTTPEGLQIGLLINHTTQERDVALPWPAVDHLSGQRFEKDLQLEAYGVAVITRAE